jgi:hypothetical protein
VIWFVAVAAFVLAACGDAAPELRHDDTVPDDLRELADETWNDFLDAFPARWDCIPPPTLHAAWELETRAEYEPATATLSVKVPGTPATLRSKLIHEFAHHVEFACEAQADLRPGFLAAQGFDPDSDWFGGDAWETTPSEQYAEAVVELIEGRRTHLGGIVISDAAIAIVAEWGSGAR